MSNNSLTDPKDTLRTNDYDDKETDSHGQPPDDDSNKGMNKIKVTVSDKPEVYMTDCRQTGARPKTLNNRRTIDKNQDMTEKKYNIRRYPVKMTTK